MKEEEEYMAAYANTTPTEEELVSQDVEFLMTQFKDKQEELNLKRRWLAGLPLSESEEEKFNKYIGSQANSTIPEILLRQDDVFYDTVKSSIEKGVGGFNEDSQNKFSKNIPLVNLQNDVTSLLYLLDYMTNECLCTIVNIVTHGLVNFEKIRWKMKKIIKEFFPKILASPNGDSCQKISLLLNDPHNFLRNPEEHLDPSSQSYKAAAIRLFDGLDGLPTYALIAMHRKIKCIDGYIPHIEKPSKGMYKRDVLISQLRRTCTKMLSKIGEGDEVQGPLIKAMGVAGLTLKLLLGCRNVTEFRKFSPEIEVLQMEIAKAIWFLKGKVRSPELLKLQLLLDPDAKLTKRSLRGTIRNLLTECLFECSDMDSIPGWLPEILAIFKDKSCSAPIRYISKEELENEVECILNLSAHLKQIVWDSSPDHEFDYDFANSYMEPLEESDDEDYNVDDIKIKSPEYRGSCSNGAHDKMGSIGESIASNFNTEHSTDVDCSSPVLTHNRNSRAELDSTRIIGIDSVESSDHSSSGHPVMEESNLQSDNTTDKQSIDRNLLLVIQGASDETSLFAYRLVGHMLAEFAQLEGLELDVDDVAYLRSGEANQKKGGVAKEKSCSDKDDCSSVLIDLVDKLMPTFPVSGKNKLEELLGTRSSKVPSSDASSNI